MVTVIEPNGGLADQSVDRTTGQLARAIVLIVVIPPIKLGRVEDDASTERLLAVHPALRVVHLIGITDHLTRGVVLPSALLERPILTNGTKAHVDGLAHLLASLVEIDLITPDGLASEAARKPGLLRIGTVHILAVAIEDLPIDLLLHQTPTPIYIGHEQVSVLTDLGKGLIETNHPIVLVADVLMLLDQIDDAVAVVVHAAGLHLPTIVVSEGLHNSI